MFKLIRKNFPLLLNDIISIETNPNQQQHRHVQCSTFQSFRVLRWSQQRKRIVFFVRTFGNLLLYKCFESNLFAYSVRIKADDACSVGDCVNIM